MNEQGDFKCLKCGLEYVEQFDPELEPQERACPKCRSNSVRRLKAKKAEGRPDASGGGKK